MVFKNKQFNKFWRFSSSFQLGIPIIVVIAVLTAWGTIVESQYDALAAKKIVYGSWMMWTVMSLLIYNLTIVVVDRWPWNMRHYPFILVHAGIITLIAGSFVTYKYGIDGQMAVPVDGKSGLVTLPNTDIAVYATFDGDRYSKMFDREVDFFDHPPTAEKPFLVDMGVDQIKIIDYAKYVILDHKVKKTTDLGAGSSIRFQLMNANVKQVEKITQPKKDRMASFNLGPARVNLGAVPLERPLTNEIYLTPLDDEKVTYTVFHKDVKKPFKQGQMKIGEVVSTGWMGLELRLLDYLFKASEEYEVIRRERPTELTTSAILIQHRDMQRWVALNDIVKLFADSSAFLMSYQNRRVPVGFDLRLDKFEIQRYQGTTKAKEYASQVTAIKNDQSTPTLISMNEPMKFDGYTIYQASFQEDPNTRVPIASVFSINQDPGRVTKYIGSLLMSLGIVWLFYQRRKRATAV
jgi:hypothetical protein